MAASTRRISKARLANPLCRWRLKAGLSVQEAAAKIGVTRLQWYRWEAGIRIPLRKDMDAIIILTDGQVTANDFVGPKAAKVIAARKLKNDEAALAA